MEEVESSPCPEFHGLHWYHDHTADTVQNSEALPKVLKGSAMAPALKPCLVSNFKLLWMLYFLLLAYGAHELQLEVIPFASGTAVQVLFRLLVSPL